MPQVDLEALEADAKAAPSRVVEKLRTVYVDPPRISLMNGLIAFLIWALLTAGITYYFVRKNNAWWRSSIAAASVKVDTAIKKANAELPDDEILRTLGESDAALREAEKRVSTPATPSSDCPVIPARCMRVR